MSEKESKPSLLIVLSLIGFCFLGACSQDSNLSREVYNGFEYLPSGSLSVVEEGDLVVGSVEAISTRSRSGKKSLKFGGWGEYQNFYNIDPVEAEKLHSITFWAERWTRNDPYEFRVEKKIHGEWQEIYNGDDKIKIGLFSTYVRIDLENHEFDNLRFVTFAPEEAGTLIDDLWLHYKDTMTVDSINLQSYISPLLINKMDNIVQHIEVFTSGVLSPKLFQSISFDQSEKIENLNLFYGGPDRNSKNAKLIGSLEKQPDGTLKSTQNVTLLPGENNFWVAASPNRELVFDESLDLRPKVLQISDKKTLLTDADGRFKLSTGIALRQHNEEGVDTYRIPGLVTSDRGTLLAVYDIRRNGSVDLQEDVDIGMSRSTDGGETWEPMKVIMDMGEWGGLPQEQNGIGDPAVLVDEETGTIWVAAVWAHGHPGERNWWASKPGMSPQETSQFMLVKSEDDGVTWSEPINITSQIKDPKWHLLLQGPGKGITMKNGTLVFPAQYKDEDEMPHSTIIYSQDRGKTWKIGTGAKPNTTESQVVELQNGSLMLNMRDNRGGSRSVYTTTDMGKTWQEHPTSRSALPEPVCMASLIKHSYQGKDYLLFSNPNSTTRREKMTIKLSADQGDTWPVTNQILLDEGVGRGYSCMTSIDEETIGILYEGSGADLVFQKIKIEDLLNNENK